MNRLGKLRDGTEPEEEITSVVKTSEKPHGSSLCNTCRIVDYGFNGNLRSHKGIIRDGISNNVSESDGLEK